MSTIERVPAAGIKRTYENVSEIKNGNGEIIVKLEYDVMPLQLTIEGCLTVKGLKDLIAFVINKDQPQVTVSVEVLKAIGLNAELTLRADFENKKLKCRMQASIEDLTLVRWKEEGK